MLIQALKQIHPCLRKNKQTPDDNKLYKYRVAQKCVDFEFRENGSPVSARAAPAFRRWTIECGFIKGNNLSHVDNPTGATGPRSYNAMVPTQSPHELTDALSPFLRELDTFQLWTWSILINWWDWKPLSQLRNALFT